MILGREASQWSCGGLDGFWGHPRGWCYRPETPGGAASEGARPQRLSGGGVVGAASLHLLPGLGRTLGSLVLRPSAFPQFGGEWWPFLEPRPPLLYLRAPFPLLLSPGVPRFLCSPSSEALVTLVFVFSLPSLHCFPHPGSSAPTFHSCGLRVPRFLSGSPPPTNHLIAFVPGERVAGHSDLSLDGSIVALEGKNFPSLHGAGMIVGASGRQIEGTS